MKFDLPRFLLMAGLVILLGSGIRGCTNSTSNASLYTGARFGPGYNFSQRGSLNVLKGPDGSVWANLRASSTSVRVQDALATPVGRVRPALVGWEYLDREGKVVCSAADSQDFSSDHTYNVLCGDRVWTLKTWARRAELQRPGAPNLTLLYDDVSTIVQQAGDPWSPPAQALVNFAATQALPLEGEAFAAKVLLAWLTRNASPQHLPEAPELQRDLSESIDSPAADPSATADSGANPDSAEENDSDPKETTSEPAETQKN